MKKTFKFVVAFGVSISLLMAANGSRCYAYGLASAIKNIAGADLDCTLTYDESYVCAIASFVGGSGTVRATAIGYFYDEEHNTIRMSFFNSNPTPGGVSASVDCIDGYSFFAAEGEYEVDSSRGKGGTNLYVKFD